MALVDDLVQKITIKADTRALDTVQRKEQKLINTTGKLDTALKSAFKLFTGAFVAKSIFDASLEMDSLERSFVAMAGGAEAGAQEIKFLRAEAERLGQSFPEIAKAYKGLFATGQGANMNNNIVRNVFSSVLEASSVLGMSAYETEGAIIALQQMISKGKVAMQELRLQLGNALPGAFQIAAKSMGVTTQEFEKMITKGVDSKEFVQKFGEELHRQFGGKKLEQSVHSLRAEFNRLKNALFDTKTGIFSGDTGKAFANVLKSITETLTSEGFKTSLLLIAKTMKIVLSNIRLIIGYKLLSKLVLFTKQFWLLKAFAKAFREEMALTSSFSLAMKAGFLTSLKVFLRLTKASLLFAKNIAVALSVLLLAEDLIASLFPGTKTTTKRAGFALGDFLTKQDAKRSAIMNPLTFTNPNMNSFGKMAGEAFSLWNKFSGNGQMTNINLPQNTPNITINQNISTGADATDIAEQTKQRLEGLFRGYNYGGAR